MLTLRTIIIKRATLCAARYHFWFSSGSFARTDTFIFVAESTLFNIKILLSSTRLYFSSNTLPASVRPLTMMRFVRLPWFTFIVVSGMSVISFSKPFFFLLSRSRGLRSFASAGFFFDLRSPPFASSSRFFLASSRFFLRASSVFLRLAAELSFLKRSFTFFRNGTWL